MRSAIQNEDRLSNLPEELLLNILSLMPTKSAVQTCILSKRWRYSWTLIHNIHFDFKYMYKILSEEDGWSRFIEGVFVHCKTTKVNIFRSHFQNNYTYNISKWIDKAVRLNVREVDISAGYYIDLPSSLFICKTLTTLRLDCRFYYTDGRFNHQSSVNLPCLKTLDLATNHPSPNTLKLIRGCQVLESLSLKVYEINMYEDIVLDIPTLKILILTFPAKDIINHTFDLNMPNLECLSIGGKLCSQFVMVDLPSLVKASFSFTSVTSTNLWVKLLKGISGVKSLSWSCSGSANHKVLSSSWLPTFPNLKRLDLKNFSENIPISQILERSPELEHLNIETLKGSCWIENVPSCKLMNLKTIRFTKVMVRKNDVRFLNYLLENAKGLKTLTITVSKMCRKEEKLLCNQFTKFQRASTDCEIHFFGCHFSVTIIYSELY